MSAPRSQRELQERRDAFVRYAETQPGCTAYTNVRPIRVRKEQGGTPLNEFLARVQPYCDDPDALQLQLIRGQLKVNDRSARPDQALLPGHVVTITVPNCVEPPIAPELDVLYEDDWVIGLSKPSPLPVHPCGRYNKNTLIAISRVVWPDLTLKPVHRLDANTTGAIVFAKTREAAQAIQQQLTARTVEKRYLVRAHGRPAEAEFEVNAPIEKAPTDRGMRALSANGREAITGFRLERALEDGTSLLIASPRTGRTNQIRLHCQAAGLPIVGDPAYGQHVPTQGGLTADEAPLYLHALSLTLAHPHSAEPFTLEAPAPAWFAAAIATATDRETSHANATAAHEPSAIVP